MNSLPSSALLNKPSYGAAFALLIISLLLLAGCSSASAQQHGMYYCPMHPQVTSDEPGDCSICGMSLVPVAKAGASADSIPEGLAPLTLRPGTRESLGMTFGSVESRSVSRTIRASGRILADESRIYRVVARAEGFIDKLYIQYAGLAVLKGQPLLGLYGLNLISVQQQFLNSIPSDGRRFLPPPSSRDAASAPGTERGDDTQRQALKYWDFSDEQINRILKTGKAESTLIVTAPISGIVTEKNAILGQKVSPGDTLFVIMDLSEVWAEADVAEMDVPSIRVGMPMELRPSSMPDRIFKGRVKYFQPLLDPQTHTMKVVLEVPNPGLALKPGMLGTVELAADTRRCLTVPEDAVMRTGRGSYVFVQEGELLVPRTVVIGPRCDGCFEVISGLKEGEKVATSANFLLDSESSLKASLQAAARK